MLHIDITKIMVDTVVMKNKLFIIFFNPLFVGFYFSYMY